MADGAGNPLIADRVDSTEWYSGVGIAEGIADLVSGVESGSWVDATIGGLATGLEALAFVLDPLGGLVAWGVAWLMEHVKPLSEALDWLAGDPDQITAYAGTWTNVAKAVAAAGMELTDAVRAEVSSWGGGAGAAYRGHAGAQVGALTGIAEASTAMASITRGAALLVALVRELVRDIIAEFVSILAVRLWEWLAIEAGTLGLGTPYVVAQVSSLVAKWAAKIARLVTGLIRSLDNLVPIVRRLDELIDSLKAVLRGLRSRPAVPSGVTAAGGPPVGGPAAGPPGAPAQPGVGAPDGVTLAGSPEPHVPGSLDSLDPKGPSTGSSGTGGPGLPNDPVGPTPAGVPDGTGTGPGEPLGRFPTGARYVADADSPAAARTYADARDSPAQSRTIAENSGIPEDVVERVRRHLFDTEHDIELGPDHVEHGYFSPLDEIAQTWRRGVEGGMTSDELDKLRRLLAHEYVESRLMEEGLPYRSRDNEVYDNELEYYAPTPEHFGAHDLAPTADPKLGGPFDHWQSLLGRDAGDLTLEPDLTNLEDIVRIALRG